MKRAGHLIRGLLLIVMFMLQGCEENCSAENIELYGHWEVVDIEIVEDGDKFREFLEAEGDDYDFVVSVFEKFKEVEFYFRKDNELFLSRPFELGGSGTTTYKYKPGENTIIYSNRSFDFEVVDCNTVILTEVHSNIGASLELQLKRVEE